LKSSSLGNDSGFLTPPLPPAAAPPFPEVWPFSEQGRENFQNPPPARPKEQKENIFRCGDEAAVMKNNLLY
jgi:hypothetical protein